MSITLFFECGHAMPASGEEQQPHCHCGCGVIVDVKAPAPVFKGFATGPCSKFEKLPATKVELKGN